ncbi:MAG TPA: hypothetical protein ENO30_06550 [Thermodesulfobium narugense]|nr:MAG: hypothetical protein C0174_03275 [Thermodesulfobium narugense]HEM56399.1 hypothetical protein [Thermodesulfobium narugense]
MVLRYTFFRTLSLVLFYLLGFLMVLCLTLMGFGIVPFPMQRDKTVYYKEARYRMNSMGMYITEAKGISVYISFKGFTIYTSRFKGKDETRFIKFLAQVSGRDEGIFCRPLSHIELFYQKFMKE